MYHFSSNDTRTEEGAQLDYLTSLYGVKQVITKPTDLSKSSARCVDLTLEYIHHYKKIKSHYKISYSKLNLKIEYLPSYNCKILD